MSGTDTRVALPDRPDGGPRTAREQRKSFRREIQGMRAFGLMLVFVAHAELAFGEGGFVALDTFFVMSGFLITGLILKEMEKTGTLSLSAFYSAACAASCRSRWSCSSSSCSRPGPLLAGSERPRGGRCDRGQPPWLIGTSRRRRWTTSRSTPPPARFSTSGRSRWRSRCICSGRRSSCWRWFSRVAGGRGRSGARCGPVMVGVGVPAFGYSVFVLDYSSHAAYFSTIPRAWELLWEARWPWRCPARWSFRHGSPACSPGAAWPR